MQNDALQTENLRMYPVWDRTTRWLHWINVLCAGLKPGSKENIDPVEYAEMRDFRKPFITIHLYTFYILAVAIALHIMAVVIAEVIEKTGLVSAMFNGKKIFSDEPVD